MCYFFKSIHKHILYEFFPDVVLRYETNKAFYNETEHVEEIIEQQEKIRNFSQNAISSSFVLKDNILEIVIEKNDYLEKYEEKLCDDIVLKIKQDGILDYSFLDKKWQEALKHRSMNELLQKKKGDNITTSQKKRGITS